VTKTTGKLDDDRLIAAHIDPDWDRYPAGRADARTRDGVPVWALVAHLRATGDDPDQLARDYGLARAAVDAARCVTGYKAAAGNCGGWSTGSQVYAMVKRPVAGKTGTTDDNRAAWFAGITPGLALVTFIADPDNPFHPIGTANHWKPVRTAAETLRDVLAGTPVLDFPPPPPELVTAAGTSTRSSSRRHSP
jgi:hypothetical protein